MADVVLKPSALVEAAAVARRYYIEGKAKTDIASEFGISRFRVARILESARDSGLVRIEISLPARIDANLSERLRSAFSLHHSIVLATLDEPEDSLRSRLAEVGAGLLTELVDGSDILGVGWGRTLHAVTIALNTLAPCTIVQLTGTIGATDITKDSVETVRRAATVSGGSVFPIYAPLVADTPEAAAVIRRQPHVAGAMRLFRDLTIAIVSVGSWNPPASQLHDALEAKERESLLRLGVRADVCGTLWDDEGHSVVVDQTTRFIAIEPAQLRAIPEVIAIAGGHAKVAAVKAVLAAGIPTSLVTDADTAHTLVAWSEEHPTGRVVAAHGRPRWLSRRGSTAGPA